MHIFYVTQLNLKSVVAGISFVHLHYEIQACVLKLHAQCEIHCLHTSVICFPKSFIPENKLP